MDNIARKVGFIAAAMVLLVVFLFVFVIRFKKIDGNERGVKVGMSGVVQEPIEPGLRSYCPFTTNFVIANIGQQRFVMNNDPGTNEKVAQGRDNDENEIRSSDNQDMYVSIEILWYRDPSKVVVQHMQVGDVSNDAEFVEKVLRQPAFTYTKNALTVMKAIDAYSGQKHVEVQEQIKQALKNDPSLVEKGCVVQDFLLRVRLDGKYTEPIKNRQIAIQEQLALVEQTKAEDAKALRAKAAAQADYNTKVVEAERAKQVAILMAEQEQQRVVLAADAAKQQVVLAAQGEKEAGQNRAEAILAVGRANAEAAKLQYAAFSAPGAETFAKIEIAKSLANAYKGVQGWIPENMTINALGENFTKGVGVVVNPAGNQQPPGPRN